MPSRRLDPLNRLRLRMGTLSRAQVTALLIVLTLFVVTLVVSVEAARMATGGD